MLSDPAHHRQMADHLAETPDDEAPPRRRRPQRSPWMQLLSAVLTLAQGKGELLRHAERPWASATFCGSRHTLALCFTGADAVSAGEDFIVALPNHEFTLTGQIVADAALLAAEHELLPDPKLTVEVELLLLEDV